MVKVKSVSMVQKSAVLGLGANGTGGGAVGSVTLVSPAHNHHVSSAVGQV